MPDDKKNQPLRQIEQTEEQRGKFGDDAEKRHHEIGLYPEAQETLIESAPEHREKENITEDFEVRKEEGEPKAGGTGGTTGDQQARLREKEIERILESDLGEIFSSLPPAKQREFKIAGEETARKINQLMAKIRLNMGKVIDLIRKWLTILPGVNRYFLEQEAKLKADEILKIYGRDAR
ncbi:MAG: hypothetical protein MUC28_00990 [Planctomycetes bacterium]|jgi:hypothetical protein|nr:hypothetical protein [Planctomycetota bacterium]